ncbi:MAG: hypothetical protein IIZ93_10705, partial [Acidaminococcaceae bacterium]|nr:hypothetical protein [Acidaminococcaceae bacterium]
RAIQPSEDRHLLASRVLQVRPGSDLTKKGAVKKVPRQTNGSQAQKRAWESFVYVVQFNCHEKPYH